MSKRDKQDHDVVIEFQDGRRKGWFWVENAIWDREELDLDAKGYYCYLCRRADKGGKSRLSIFRICKDLGIGRDKQERLSQQLIDAGVLIVRQTKRKGKFSHNIYRVLSP